MPKTIGKELADLRAIAGYESLSDLSRASGVTVATLSRIENDIQKPSPSTLEKLANPLNVSHDYLMELAGYISSSDTETSYLRRRIAELSEEINSVKEHSDRYDTSFGEAAIRANLASKQAKLRDFQRLLEEKESSIASDNIKVNTSSNETKSQLLKLFMKLPIDEKKAVLQLFIDNLTE